MPMHDPPHPGAVIRRQCLEPLGLTVTAAAEGLGVSRNTLSMLLNGRLGISPEWRPPVARASEAARKAGSSSRCSTTSGRARQRGDGIRGAKIRGGVAARLSPALPVLRLRRSVEILVVHVGGVPRSGAAMPSASLASTRMRAARLNSAPKMPRLLSGQTSGRSCNRRACGTRARRAGVSTCQRSMPLISLFVGLDRVARAEAGADAAFRADLVDAEIPRSVGRQRHVGGHRAEPEGRAELGRYQRAVLAKLAQPGQPGERRHRDVALIGLHRRRVAEGRRSGGRA